jgi:hypothetical protein
MTDELIITKTKAPDLRVSTPQFALYIDLALVWEIKKYISKKNKK